jgi:hypothetical protein
LASSGFQVESRGGVPNLVSRKLERVSPHLTPVHQSTSQNQPQPMADTNLDLDIVLSELEKGAGKEPESQNSTQSIRGCTRQEEPLKAIIKTVFEGRECSAWWDLPSGSAVETYQFIADTAKSFIEKHARHRLGDDELSLASGTCTISYRGEASHSQIKESKHRLETPEDWGDIAVILGNHKLHYKNLEVTIVRQLELTRKRIVMAELPTSDKLYRKLKNELWSAEKTVAGERPLIYIPKHEVERVAKKDIITRVIQDDNGLDLQTKEREKFATDIYSHGPILFAIFVKRRLPFMLLSVMLRNGINDKKLPWTDPIPQSIVEMLPDEFGRDDRTSDFKAILEEQWRFKAVVFQKLGEHHVLHPNIVVPFLLKKECGHGAFSNVYEVQLEPSHQRIYKLPKVFFKLLSALVTFKS